MVAQFPSSGNYTVEEITIPEEYRPLHGEYASFAEVSGTNVMGTGRFIVYEKVSLHVENPGYTERIACLTWISAIEGGYMENRIITAVFKDSKNTKVSDVWQWDYGQILRIQGLNLPTAVEVDFAVAGASESISRIGTTKDGVTDVVIPDSLIETGNNLVAYIYLRDAESGNTEYQIDMIVTKRAKPEAYDTPEDKELFGQAIEAVNAAADRAEKAGKTAQEAATKTGQDAEQTAQDRVEVAKMVETVTDISEQVKKVEDLSNKAQAAATKTEADAQQTAEDRVEVGKMLETVKDVSEQVKTVEESVRKAKESEQAAEGHRTAVEEMKNSVEQTKMLETVKDVSEQVKTVEESVRKAKESEQAAEGHRTAVEEMKNSVEQTASGITQVVQTGVQEINSAKQSAVQEVTQTGTAQKTAVEGAGTQAVESVENAQQAATEAVESAKTTAVQAVQAEGTTQTGNVTTEGTKQVKAVQDKGNEVLQSIPEDFQMQMESKLDKQQGIENKGKVLVIGQDGSVVPREVQGGGNGLVGEVLLADYTHQGNPEFHFSDFDFITGIGTTTEPHGLTKKTEVLMCPNDWTILNPFENMLSMPIEWTMVEKLSDALALIPIDDTHLKVVASKEEAIINVNLDDVSNTNVNFTKFHFEKPISYVVKNLDNKINAKYIKVLASGYCSYTGIYRYRNVSVLFESGKTGTVKYINTLGFSRDGMSPARNGVFLSEETLIDLRNNTKYYNKALSYARRKGYSSLVNDPYRAVDDTWILTQSENVKAIKAYSTYSDTFAYMSNGTRIQFYALEGEYKNES